MAGTTNQLRCVSKALSRALAAGFVVGVCLAGYYLSQVGGLAFTPMAAPIQEANANGPPLPLDPATPGIRLPPMHPAASAHLHDDDEVLGVVVGGKARAYSLEALSGGLTRHVVNDLVGGQPVSVAYCDIDDCARVYSGPPGQEPLDVGVLTKLKVGLALRVGEADYAQETGERLGNGPGGHIPLPELEYVRTTWRKWREAHPDTDVYEGVQPHEG